MWLGVGVACTACSICPGCRRATEKPIIVGTIGDLEHGGGVLCFCLPFTCEVQICGSGKILYDKIYCIVSFLIEYICIM